jgi:hypothetical protein
MFNSRIAAVILISFLFTFCDNEDLVSPPGQIPEKRLTKISRDDSNFMDFFYAESKLFKFKEVKDSKITKSISLEYNGSSKPVNEKEIVSNLKLIKNYFYDDMGRLFMTVYYRENSPGNFMMAGYFEYGYNGQNQLIEKTQFNYSGNLVFKNEFVYDGKDNVIEKNIYDRNGLYSTTTFTYDDKINPWYGMSNWLNYDAPMSPNNMITNYQVDRDGNVKFQAAYNYNYDEFGYPLSRESRVIIDGVTDLYTEYYSYE